jgi:hypothetical protein
VDRSLLDRQHGLPENPAEISLKIWRDLLENTAEISLKNLPGIYLKIPQRST